MAKYKIGILETGRPPEELLGEFGNYPHMVEEWLGRIDAEFTRFAVLDGEFPDRADQCDLWVITGSKFGCYEEHEWIAPLEAFIRAAKKAKKIMFGICFGHQIIAQALGGKVQKFDAGWALGVNQYDITDWPVELGNAPENISLQAYHHDQIVSLPKDAEIVATSEFCEYAALYYPDFALTVQSHPEFSKAYASALLECRRGTGLRSTEVDRGLANMEQADNRDVIADIVENYLMKDVTYA